MAAREDQRAVTSSSLLDRVKLKDLEAWDQLVSIYTPLVFHWCQESGLNPDDAADVMQEVFRSVAAAIASFRRQKTGSFRGWLRTITANKIRDLVRKKRGHMQAVGGTGWNLQLQELPESVSDEETAAETGLITSRVLELLASKFKESNRRAFWLVTVEGHTAAEAAEKLEITEQAVWQACYRIRRRLREELADLLD